MSLSTSAMAFNWKCDGPPFDPCELTKQGWIQEGNPDQIKNMSQEELKKFTAPTNSRVEQIHYNTAQENISSSKNIVNALIDMGIIDGFAENVKSRYKIIPEMKNGLPFYFDTAAGASIDFCVWMVGAKTPQNHKSNELYTADDFYNRSNAIFTRFDYMIQPFAYEKGWNKCQPLKYMPTKSEQQRAYDSLYAMINFTHVMTKPYDYQASDDHSHSGTAERMKSILDYQDTINKDREEAYTKYDVVEAVNYCRSKYISFQQTYVSGGNANYRNDIPPTSKQCVNQRPPMPI